MIGPHSRCLLHALAARVGVQWYLGAHRSSSWEARRCHAAPSAMPPYTGRVLQQTYGSHAYVPREVELVLSLRGVCESGPAARLMHRRPCMATRV